ncbi:EscU/YscU/HrcU family type III secretion system export apparatus switch protein [Demequina zhanjiangensis]|uniref:EscU/YscU/HrcU family type III secretion system export apparatus switch protein n=1 Tax=Demequina zhanjiangensis TaxID=3051659 RepID=A0ABT8G078_9MICO|nr:EscU/YscU/HrcU family type III secretion system export apparatus switch protein [Demequina sp. SYSU T00b26]MDN4472359.1 EscU/YscU/HrcU family type III secretion system export apparatus switch protein [Demequina sp. SYSU T00b26]
MSNDEAGEKSEKATPKRMKQLRRDGALQKSQDLSAWIGVGSAVLMLPFVISHGAQAAEEQLVAIKGIAEAPDSLAALESLQGGLGSVIVTMAPLLGVVVLAAIIGSAAQGGIHISAKRLKPKFEQFNPKNGAKKVFGKEAWWNGLKAALKAAAIGTVLYVVIQGMVPVMLGSGSHSLESFIGFATDGVSSLVRIAVFAGLTLAAADVFVIMKRNRKKTRMSKKEIKDEHKQMEGDPHIKGQIRARQIAMSRNRMMAEIAGADVVMVNPTHVAVALKYEPGTGAPRVVAKGSGHIAAKIREKATENRVPMVQDIPLARALHAACELGDEIPPHLYAAVARVLAFVMALRRRGAAAGMHRDPHAEAVAA